jgi:ketosteroid isomerase-like protein
VPSLSKTLLFSSADECERAFYDGLAAADAEAVADLWLDDEDVCCVHPNGPRLIGHAAVVSSWRAILENGALRIRAIAGKSLETTSVTINNVVEELVIGEGRGQKIVQVIATNAYVKTPGGWKMVLHHASPAPEGSAADIEIPGGLLH